MTSEGIECCLDGWTPSTCNQVAVSNRTGLNIKFF